MSPREMLLADGFVPVGILTTAYANSAVSISMSKPSCVAARMFERQAEGTTRGNIMSATQFIHHHAIRAKMAASEPYNSAMGRDFRRRLILNT